jgi:hypothetical protein
MMTPSLIHTQILSVRCKHFRSNSHRFQSYCDNFLLQLSSLRKITLNCSVEPMEGFIERIKTLPQLYSLELLPEYYVEENATGCVTVHYDERNSGPFKQLFRQLHSKQCKYYGAENIIITDKPLFPALTEFTCPDEGRWSYINNSSIGDYIF